MAEQKENTYESTILDNNPGTRARVLVSKEFHEWKDKLPSLVVDDVTYYIRGGDMLRDEDQLIVEWAQRSGLLSEESFDQGRLTRVQLKNDSGHQIRSSS